MSKARRYRLAVYATVAIDEETGEPEYTPIQIEKHIYRVLKVAQPDCDCETLDWEEIEEP